ncbi:MAG: FxLYD domain-containing protein [Bryobacteraceae bacterium]
MIAVVTGLVAAGAGAFYWLDYQAKHYTPPQPVLTPEAKAYVRNLALSEVQMQAAESYLKQAVVEIEGKISNKGDRRVNVVEVNCVFRDPYTQVVLRERVAIVGLKSGSLAPGETKRFRLAFDSVPESWNRAMPDLVIAQIQFSS